MNRKNLFVMLITLILGFAFTGCFNNNTPAEEENPDAPVITDAFFVEVPDNADKLYTILPSSDKIPLVKLNSISRFTSIPAKPHYCLYVRFSDDNKDVKKLHEVSIPDLNCPLSSHNKMTSTDSYAIWGLAYTTEEIPDDYISDDGKYTFEFVLEDEEGNLSDIFELTVNIK